MPVYEIKVKGSEKSRMVKADTMAAAIADVVEVKAISAERMLELQDEGVTLEKAKADPDPADPANYAPGGPLHGKTKPASVIAAEQAAITAAGESGGAGEEGSGSGGSGKAAGGKAGKEG